MKEGPEQLSFWGEGRQKLKIEPSRVEVDTSQTSPIVKVSFEYQNDKGVIIELTFTFEGSINNLKYSKIVIKSPEGLRTFDSQASLEENTWIDDDSFQTMKHKAIAIASSRFQELDKERETDNKQLKFFD